MAFTVTLTGQLSVEAGGRTLHEASLPGRQGRLVFAYLVAERHRPVPSEELADAVWGGAPPPTWRAALRGVVSKVRGFLDELGLPAGDALTHSSGCYLLRLPVNATVDLELAARGADEAERALGAGDLEATLAAAAAARAVAGRPLLPGQEGDWLERRRAGLHRILVRSLEVQVDVHLQAGQGDRAVLAAEELVGLEPYRESAHLRLLRALAASGDRGEALRAFERCRHLLSEELGVAPSAELEAAHVDLLRPGPSARPGGPGPPAAVAGPPVDDGRFVGRRSELARLRSAWAAARAGQFRISLLAGEAGIGKSRLAGELATLAGRQGATVLRGRCDDQLGAAYLPFREALGRHLVAAPADRQRALAGSHGGELTRFWPELAWRLPGPGPGLPEPARERPDAERYLLFEAVTGLLEAIAADSGPVLLLIEDLHLADEPSLVLLRHLAHVARPATLLLVAAYRDDETAGTGLMATLDDLLRVPGAERLALGGLGPGEVAAMTGAAVGRPLGAAGEALGRVLHRRTRGNPLIVGQLLRHLAESGALDGPDLAGVATGPAADDVPEALNWVVQRRLARLGDAVEHVLGVAAVIGHGADLALLTRVVDLGFDELLAALDAAVRAKLLEVRPGAPGHYDFRHAIVRDLLYARLPAARRGLLHDQVGEALLTVGDLGGIDRFIADQERRAAQPQGAYPAWHAQVLRATRATMRGDFAAGERLAGEALARGRITVGDGAALAGGTQLVVVRWLQGRPGEVQALLEGWARDPSRQGWRRLLPLAWAGQGREADARRHLDGAVDGRRGRLGGIHVLGLVGACALLGDATVAARLHELLRPLQGWHLTAGGPAYLGAIDHHLGILAATAGRWDQAERHLRAALSAHRRLAARPWLALTRQACAGVLRGRGGPGDHDRAARLDAAARSVAAALGMDLPGWGRPALGPRP